MTQLSPHFTLAEMTRSTTAIRKGIPNVPSIDDIRALTLLCVKVLEPVREHYGKPVIVTSGYRAPRVNVAVGGSPSSDHCFGRAADFSVADVDNYEVACWIRDNLNYKQLILEFPPDGWVHCAYVGPPFKNQELTAVRRQGKTAYLPGLVV